MIEYSSEFYENQQEGSRRSANRIVPIVLDLVSPNSVVDVGCGVGTWLAVFAEHGVSEILGIEGGDVERTPLQIPQQWFVLHDLTKPLRLGRQFDLVVCLEVAEHLEQEHAPTLIEGLTGLGPVVLFSAAIPYQGGTNHVNEQWPEYWAGLFAAKGYVAVDCIRDKVWRYDDVEWWYAQNTLLYVESGKFEKDGGLRQSGLKSSRVPLSRIHPRKYVDTIFQLRLAQESCAIIPPEESFVLVDDGEYGVEAIPGRSGVPFLEHDGIYWGEPADDDEAVRELERLRESGSGFLIFAWVSFWWLEHYTKFHDYLRSRFKCVKENDCIIAFDIRHTYV
jgi:SAM-dependent methyltransferase